MPDQEANPRAVALRALIEWQRGKTFADEILHAAQAKARLSDRDRAFFREMFYGTIRWLGELDFLIGCLRDAPLEDETRAILRLGFYQLWHMRVPEHAVVNEAVSLAGRARGVVNAVLRRALREHGDLERALDRAPRAARWSHPQFLIDRWISAFGQDAARALCEWNNQPSTVFVRANGLRASVEELRRSLPAARLVAAHPCALAVDQLPPEWLSEGLCYVQDPSTLLACDLLAPQPGETVLDLCAAPGGKTSYLAELMRNEGRLVACDLWESRLERLRENMQRLGVRNVEPLVHDGMRASEQLAPASFDRILVDAPCSNTGVIRRRVDVRWRLTEEDFLRMPAQQLALLRRSAELLKPGGTLVYSTCSLEPEENEGVVKGLLAQAPMLRLVEQQRLLPFADDVDGAFAAKLTRVG